jgi:hypothetical protein
MAPFDYGPILLRKPFRLHLTVDALSSGCRSRQSANLGKFLWLFPSFPTSCPFKVSLFTFPGQRDITPAFGYDALHLSVRGILTLLSYMLPSTHYGPVRLPTAVHRRRVPFGFSARTPAPCSGVGCGISRFPCERFMRMLRVSDLAGSVHHSR